MDLVVLEMPRISRCERILQNLKSAAFRVWDFILKIAFIAFAAGLFLAGLAAVVYAYNSKPAQHSANCTI